MIRIFSLFILLFGLSSVAAQTYNIEWKGTEIIDYGTEKITIPKINNPGFAYEEGTVFFRVPEKSKNVLREIKDLVWEKISSKDLLDIDAANVPFGNKSEIGNYSDPYTGENRDVFRVAALKQEAGVFFRLKSFTITNTDASLQKTARSAGTQLGTTENPLKSGNFYKIKVDKSGVFKITAQFLRENGINPATINPKNFRIYGNGGLMLPEHNLDARYATLQQNAIQVVGEEDGVWNDQDYALFYAQGPHGFNIHQGADDPSGKRRIEMRTDASLNFVNIYDDYAYYFINFDLGPGKRVIDDSAPLNSNIITRYDAYQFINEEKFNLIKVGRIWTGDPFTDTKTVTFNTKSPIQPTDEIKYRTRVIAYQANGTSISISLNSVPESIVGVSSNSTKEYTPITYPYSYVPGKATGLSGNQLTFTYKPVNSSNPNGKFYFDYAEVQYREDLKYTDGQFNFRRYDIDENSGNTYTFQISGADQIEQVWQVADITNAKRKLNKSGSNTLFSFAYTANSEFFTNEFVAFKAADAFSPTFVGKIENQDLSSLQNISYLMITVPEMMSQAQRLAAMHQKEHTVAVVDINKIYNEFSSGGKDITAIRDFATKLNASKQLKYMFLLGDTSYDYKGKVNQGSDVIPAYQSEESRDHETSYVTDDYYTMTSPQSIYARTLYSTMPDLPVGRLPAANLSDAKLLIDKTLAYNNALPGQSTPFGEWRMKLDFVVDDDADAGVPFHNTMNSAIIKANLETGTVQNASGTTTFQTDKPEYNVRKLYMDAFPAQTSAGGQRYPQVNQAITNDMGNSLFLFYFGHGGINGWAQERVLSLDEIKNFNNFNNVYSRFPLVSTITCEFTLWDEPTTFSAGEQVLKLKQGGAASMLTSSRKIGVIYGEEFTTILTEKIFELNNDDFNSLGDAFLKAKSERGSHADHLRVNLLGDPAMKLSRPKRNLVIYPVESPVRNQLRALDFVKVKGHITKADGTVDNTFNGRVAVNIFDKRILKKTLNNDNDSKMTPVLNYTEENGPIVKSSGQAVNGLFSVEFYVPKDINYEIGDGRILVYADNKVIDVFNNKSQKIGGINPEGINDTKAPTVQLFMNNTNFADGGITDQNPTLLACVTDDKGINSTGSGIGHDITVILDGKVIDTVVLNDFYFSGDGNGCINASLSDYQKGNVTYPFRNLAPGPHQLTFKVWDINNNSTTGTLNFVVKDEADQKLTIQKPLNWPNPFTNKTYVQFEHNCDDMLDVNVQIYTITGKLVRTISTAVTAQPFLQGFRTPRTAIEWDGNDDFGDAVGKGTYIFKIFARSQNQDKCKGSATAVEKMVLLK